MTKARDIADGVDTADIADGAVTSAKLDTNIEVTGNLTVDTNTLYVDATNNRVGIGTSTPAGLLHISGSDPELFFTDTSTGVIHSLDGNSGVGNFYIHVDKGDTGSDPKFILNVGSNSDVLVANEAGNVGIGTGSPSEALTVIGNGVFGDATTKYNRITINGGHVGDGDNDYGLTINAFEPAITLLDRSTGSGSGQMRVQSSGAFWLLGDTTNDGTIGHTANTTDFVMAKFEPDQHVFFIDSGATEAMRFDSNGRIVVASASPSSDAYVKIPVGGTTLGAIATTSGSTSTRKAIYFNNPNGEVGSISTSGTATAYTTSSDYRLKENIVDMDNAIDRVKALSPKRFNFISDADTTVDGFLAHEVQDIVPEAISGEKDATKEEEYEVTPAVLDDDGNVVTEAVMGTRIVPDYQGIDQSKLVPLLTGALQEALAKIDDLETRIAALEAN